MYKKEGIWSEIRRDLKKHLALPMLGLAVVIIGMGLVQVPAQKDRAMFQLEDQYGDRSVLEEVRISGELKDAYHKSAFLIENGQARAETEVYEVPQAIDWRDTRYPWFRTVQLNDRTYSISLMDVDPLEEYNLFHVTYDLISDPNQRGNTFLQHMLEFNNNRDRRLESAMELDRGFAEVGGSIYYVFPTTTEFSGTNGIYELDFMEYHGITRIKNGLEGLPMSQKINELDLSGNNKFPSEELQVLGLEAVGEKLVMILTEGGQLIVRGYDRHSGDIFSEVVIERFSELVNMDSKIIYDSQYDASVNEAERVLTLSFMVRAEQVERVIYNFAVDREVRLLDEIKLEFPQITLSDHDFVYKNGKLFVTGITEEGRDVQVPYEEHVFVQVYEGEELVYEGKLLMDHNDDLLKGSNAREARYSRNEDRNIYNLRVE